MEIVVLIVIFLFVLNYAHGKSRSPTKDMQSNKSSYDEALKMLRSNPNDFQLKQEVLEKGRRYYASTHRGRSLAKDEAAIQNDIIIHSR